MQPRNRKKTGFSVWPLIGSLAIAVMLPGCWNEPARRILAPEQERHLQQQTDYTYSLPEDQRALGQKQVECNRAILEQGYKCDPLVPAEQVPVMNDRSKAVDSVIDRNLRDALDRTKR